MTAGTDLPPHLEQIGRQLTAAAREIKISERPPARARARAVLRFAPLLTAVVAALVILLNQGGSARRRVTTTPAPVALAPIVHPTAGKVLARAAFVALQRSPVTPSPDQFVYTRTEASDGSISQFWYSVDGSRTSLEQLGSSPPITIPGCVNGEMSSRSFGEDGKPISDFLPKRLQGGPGIPISDGQIAKYFGGKIPMDGPVVTSHCTAQPAFFPDMPTDAGAMQAYLLKVGATYPSGTYSGNPADVAQDEVNNLAKNVGWMLDTDYLLPAQQAALYRYLATTPGITVRQGVKDVAGRPGIGVGWSFYGSSAMLVFDPTTYQYLGTTTTGTGGQVAGDALLQTAIVDAAGQQPPAPEDGYARSATS